jgi:hypothetical protein
MAVASSPSLPLGANGSPVATHMAGAVPDAIAPEVLEAYRAQAAGTSLRPEQELLLLHQQKKQMETAAKAGKAGIVGLAGLGGSVAASTITQKALEKGIEKGVEKGGTEALKAVAGKAGMVGQGVSLAVTAVSGDMEAKTRLSELVGIHIEDLQREFNIKPEEMTDAHLRRLAEMPGYEQLKTEIQGLDQKMMRAVVGGAASTAGWALPAALPLLVGGAALTGTGVGAVVGIPAIVASGGLLVASLATSMVAGSVADKAVTAITGVDDKDSAYSELTKMQQKLEKREPVDQIDVFKALLAGDKALQEKVKTQSGGKKFDELEPDKQLELLQMHHGNLLDASKQLAYQINCGDTLPNRLISLNTTALAAEGAQAAYDLTRGDVMRGTGINLMATQNAANNIVSFGKPTTTIDTDGALSITLQPRAQGMGAQQAALAARQTQEAGMQAQLGA